METLPLLRAQVICRQASSYDRRGGNDNGFTNKAEWIRREKRARVVIFDALGPGSIRNIALSWPNHPRAPRLIERLWGRWLGRIKFFFGGETTATIDAPVRSLIGTEPHSYPLAVTAEQSPGSNASYVPVDFERGLKITVDGGGLPMVFHRIWYHCYPLGTPMLGEGAAGSSQALARWLDPEQARKPTRPLAVDLHDVVVPAGESCDVFRADTCGTVRCLRMQLPEDDDALRTVWLRAWWDDDEDPSIEAPLSLLFAVENRYSQQPAKQWENAEMRGAVVGQDPDGYSYLRLPMPYARRARIAVENRAERDVTLNGVRIEATNTVLPGLGGVAGYLRTQFRESRELTPGRDYVLAQLKGRGHIVGTILAVEDTSETFLEGDERIYTDGSRTPSVIGDATETYFNGGWYFWEKAFSCPLHGVSAFRMRKAGIGSNSDITMYRFHVTDWIPYRREARFSIQHGPFNDVPGNYRSLVFYYGLPSDGLVDSDAVNLAEPSDFEDHGFVGTADRQRKRDGFFTGEGNGQDLGLRSCPSWLHPMLWVLYLTVRGIFRDPPRDSPDRVRFTMSEYGAPHEFTVKVDPAASAIMLRRVFDQSVADQRARIDVDGVLAGLWLNAGRNKWKIFAEDDLILDPDATAGKSELRIRITPESKRFTAAEYKVFSLVDA